jgi:hypothetical protein
MTIEDNKAVHIGALEKRNEVLMKCLDVLEKRMESLKKFGFDEVLDNIDNTYLCVMRVGDFSAALRAIEMNRLEDSSKGYPEFECECKRLRIENNSLKSAITKFKDVNGDLVSARNALGEMVDRLQVENKSLKAKNASLIANLRSRGYVSL